MFRKIISFLIILIFGFESTGFAQVAGQLDISSRMASAYNTMVMEKFRPVHLRYLSYDQQSNDFKLMLDKGSVKNQKSEEIKKVTTELMKYFYIGLALPNDVFWVNLRPDAAESIIDENLAKTDIGRIMLESDLQLKKDLAKYTCPSMIEGKEYWDKLYKKAQELYGQDNTTIPTLVRPWIVPDEIIIKEVQGSAYIYKATLKVMLEQDYLKTDATYNFADDKARALNKYASKLVRENIIPKLNKEINSNKKYANLRQVYYSLILAQWFKSKYNNAVIPAKAGIQNSIMSSKIDSKDLTNLTSQESWSKETYYQAYQKSFKEGEYSIKEPKFTANGQVIRNYVSGGEIFNMLPAIEAGIMRLTNDDSGKVIQDADYLVSASIIDEEIGINEDNGFRNESYKNTDLVTVNYLNAGESAASYYRERGLQLLFTGEKIVKATEFQNNNKRKIGVVLPGLNILDLGLLQKRDEDMVFNPSAMRNILLNDFKEKKFLEDYDLLFILPLEEGLEIDKDTGKVKTKKALTFNSGLMQPYLTLSTFTEPVVLDKIFYNGHSQELADKLENLGYAKTTHHSFSKDKKDNKKILQLAGVKIVDYIIFDKKSNLDKQSIFNLIQNFLDEHSNFEEIVVKPTNESQGNGIKMFNREKIDEIVLYVQWLLKNNGDIILEERIPSFPVYHDEKRIDWNLRVLFGWTNEKIFIDYDTIEVRHDLYNENPVNVSQGAGVENFYEFLQKSGFSDAEIKDLFKRIKIDAQKLIKATKEKNGFIGLDLIVDQNKNLHTIEVNSGQVGGFGSLFDINSKDYQRKFKATQVLADFIEALPEKITVNNKEQKFNFQLDKYSLILRNMEWLVLSDELSKQDKTWSNIGVTLKNNLDVYQQEYYFYWFLSYYFYRGKDYEKSYEVIEQGLERADIKSFPRSNSENKKQELFKRTLGFSILYFVVSEIFKGVSLLVRTKNKFSSNTKRIKYSEIFIDHGKINELTDEQLVNFFTVSDENDSQDIISFMKSLSVREKIELASVLRKGLVLTETTNQIFFNLAVLVEDAFLEVYKNNSKTLTDLIYMLPPKLAVRAIKFAEDNNEELSTMFKPLSSKVALILSGKKNVPQEYWSNLDEIVEYYLDEHVFYGDREELIRQAVNDGGVKTLPQEYEKIIVVHEITFEEQRKALEELDKIKIAANIKRATMAALLIHYNIPVKKYLLESKVSTVSDNILFLKSKSLSGLYSKNPRILTTSLLRENLDLLETRGLSRLYEQNMEILRSGQLKENLVLLEKEGLKDLYIRNPMILTSQQVKENLILLEDKNLNSLYMQNPQILTSMQLAINLTLLEERGLSNLYVQNPQILTSTLLEKNLNLLESMGLSRLYINNPYILTYMYLPETLKLYEEYDLFFTLKSGNDLAGKKIVLDEQKRDEWLLDNFMNRNHIFHALGNIKIDGTDKLITKLSELDSTALLEILNQLSENPVYSLSIGRFAEHYQNFIEKKSNVSNYGNNEIFVDTGKTADGGFEDLEINPGEVLRINDSFYVERDILFLKQEKDRIYGINIYDDQIYNESIQNIVSVKKITYRSKFLVNVADIILKEAEQFKGYFSNALYRGISRAQVFGNIKKSEGNFYIVSYEVGDDLPEVIYEVKYGPDKVLYREVESNVKGVIEELGTISVLEESLRVGVMLTEIRTAEKIMQKLPKSGHKVVTEIYGRKISIIQQNKMIQELLVNIIFAQNYGEIIQGENSEVLIKVDDFVEKINLKKEDGKEYLELRISGEKSPINIYLDNAKKRLIFGAINSAIIKQENKSKVREVDVTKDEKIEKFIFAQMSKLLGKDFLEWGKLKNTPENMQKAENSIMEIRKVLIELLELVGKNNSLRKHENRIWQAIDIVFSEQGKKLRADAKLYPIHPLQAALNFIKNYGITDPDLIIAALLHDTVEDVDKFRNNPSLIGQMFGEKVQEYVQTVTNKELTQNQKDKLKKYLDFTDSDEDKKVQAIFEYQIGVILEVTDNLPGVLLKSVDFSDNALTQKNLASDLQLQARLSTKYRDLLIFFAQEFEKYTQVQQDNELKEGLLRNAKLYREAYEELDFYSENWMYTDEYQEKLEIVKNKFGGIRELAQEIGDGGVESGDVTQIEEVKALLTEFVKFVESDYLLKNQKEVIYKAIEVLFDEQGKRVTKDGKLYVLHQLQAALNFIKKFDIVNGKILEKDTQWMAELLEGLFEKKHYKKIINENKISEEDFQKAFEILRDLKVIADSRSVLMAALFVHYGLKIRKDLLGKNIITVSKNILFLRKKNLEDLYKKDMSILVSLQVEENLLVLDKNNLSELYFRNARILKTRNLDQKIKFLDENGLSDLYKQNPSVLTTMQLEKNLKILNEKGLSSLYKRNPIILISLLLEKNLEIFDSKGLQDIYMQNPMVLNSEQIERNLRILDEKELSYLYIQNPYVLTAQQLEKNLHIFDQKGLSSIYKQNVEVLRSTQLEENLQFLDQRGLSDLYKQNPVLLLSVSLEKNLNILDDRGLSELYLRNPGILTAKLLDQNIKLLNDRGLEALYKQSPEVLRSMLLETNLKALDDKKLTYIYMQNPDVLRATQLVMNLQIFDKRGLSQIYKKNSDALKATKLEENLKILDDRGLSYLYNQNADILKSTQLEKNLKILDEKKLSQLYKQNPIILMSTLLEGNLRILDTRDLSLLYKQSPHVLVSMQLEKNLIFLDAKGLSEIYKKNPQILISVQLENNINILDIRGLSQLYKQSPEVLKATNLEDNLRILDARDLSYLYIQNPQILVSGQLEKNLQILDDRGLAQVYKQNSDVLRAIALKQNLEFLENKNLSELYKKNPQILRSLRLQENLAILDVRGLSQIYLKNPLVLTYGNLEERLGILNNDELMGLGDDFINVDERADGGVKKKLGGIGFVNLPIEIQPMGKALIQEIENMPKIVISDLNREWASIEKLVNGGVAPSNNRIKRFLSVCLQKQELKMRAAKIVSCLAEIMRMDEDAAKSTDPQVKTMLALLEYNR